VKKSAEKFNRLSRVHQRHRQTDRRQTTDGRLIAYSERNVVRSLKIVDDKASEPETSRPVEKRNFTTPPAFGAPLGVIPSEFRRDHLCHKTRVPGLWYGVVCVILSLAVLIECRLMTDERTDTQ